MVVQFQLLYALVVATSLTLLFTSVKGKFAIVAVDHRTKQVGGAGVSCAQDEDTAGYVYTSVPGKGAAIIESTLAEVLDHQSHGEEFEGTIQDGSSSSVVEVEDNTNDVDNNTSAEISNEEFNVTSLDGNIYEESSIRIQNRAGNVEEGALVFLNGSTIAYDPSNYEMKSERTNDIYAQVRKMIRDDESPDKMIETMSEVAKSETESYFEETEYDVGRTDGGRISGASFCEQYGVVTVKGKGKGWRKTNQAAGFTDGNCPTHKNTIARNAKKGFSYTIQGNGLAEEGTLDALKTGFEAKKSTKQKKKTRRRLKTKEVKEAKDGRKKCDDLAERLYRAVLEATVENNEDQSIFANGCPAESIFIHVDDPYGSEFDGRDGVSTSSRAYLDIKVPSTKNGASLNTSIIDDFIDAFETWRVDNPCTGRAPGAMELVAPVAGVGLAAVAIAGVIMAGRKKTRRAMTGK